MICTKQFINKVSLLICAVCCVLAAQNVVAEEVLSSTDEPELNVEQGDEGNFLRSSTTDAPSQAIPTKSKKLKYCGRAMDAAGIIFVGLAYEDCMADAENQYASCLRNAGSLFRLCVMSESRKTNPSYGRCHEERTRDNSLCDEDYSQSAAICTANMIVEELDVSLPSIGPFGPVFFLKRCADVVWGGTSASE